MLVKFTNKSGGTVDMFEKTALELIKMMGRREAVPSAISKEDLPGALSQLEKELARIEQTEQAEPEDDLDESEDEAKPKQVGIGLRAFPLIELIKQSIKDDSFLMWDYS